METSDIKPVYQSIAALAGILNNVSTSYLIKVLLDAHVINLPQTYLLENHHRSITNQ